MPTTLLCGVNTVVKSCCDGGNTTKKGKMLEIDDGINPVVKIDCPFTVVYKTTEMLVYDTNQNYAKVVLADTSFSTIDDLITFANSCSSGAINYQRFVNVTTDFVAITNFVLPDPAVISADDIRKTLHVFIDGLKSTYSDHFTINKGLERIVFNEDANGELIQVFY